MGFPRTKLGLNPVALPNGIVFPFWIVGCRQLAKDIIQERTDRPNQKLIDRSCFGLALLFGFIRPMIGPNMLFNHINTDQIIRNRRDLIE